MKTLIRFSKLVIVPILFSLGLVGCGSSNTSSTTAAATTYGYINGICYNTSNSTQVATSYCSSTTGYYLSGAYCYNSSGVQVSVSYCSTATSTTSTTGYTAQVCYGNYYYSNGYTTQLVACYGSNCRGYIMYAPTTGQPILCQ